MNSPSTTLPSPRQAAPAPLDARLGDRWLLSALGIGLLALYAPALAELYHVVWSTDEQGQGTAILMISLWLLWRQRTGLAALSPQPAPRTGWVLFALALALYWVGRTQGVLMFTAFSMIPMCAGLLLMFIGWAAVRQVWFCLFFMLFLIPLPGPFVSAATAPLKAGVSYVASVLLGALGYPIARSGVVLMIGPYQLLVADACAGLTSMFTLEALGLLYMNLQGHASRLRNTVLALLLVPISFTSNVVRVMLLVLVTFHFGDAAGRGFVHDFAGVLLFVVAIGLMLATDAVLGRMLRDGTVKP